MPFHVPPLSVCYISFSKIVNVRIPNLPNPISQKINLGAKFVVFLSSSVYLLASMLLDVKATLYMHGGLLKTHHRT